MQVNDQNGNPIQAQPVPQVEDQCAPVAVNGNGTVLPVPPLRGGHAARTRRAGGGRPDGGQRRRRGQVDAGHQLHPRRARSRRTSPSSPDAQMTFVSSADPNKPAIYGIPNNRHPRATPAGDPAEAAAAADRSPRRARCRSRPSALTIAPVGTAGRYVLIAMLDAFCGQPAKIAAIDPDAAARGRRADRRGAGGGPGLAQRVHGSGRDRAIARLAALLHAGTAWPDGVPYAGDGRDLARRRGACRWARLCSTGGTGTPRSGRVSADLRAAGRPASQRRW